MFTYSIRTTRPCIIHKASGKKVSYFVRFTLKAVPRQELLPALTLNGQEVALCVHWLDEVLVASDVVTAKKRSQTWNMIDLRQHYREDEVTSRKEFYQSK